MTYEPLEKRPVLPPQECRCAACNRPLKTGLGYFVRDTLSGEELPAGPKCFKDMTGGLSPHSIPVLGLGTVVEEGPSGKGGSVSEAQNRAARSVDDRRRSRAQANILLRAHFLPAAGFVNTDRRLFTEFLARARNLSMDDVAAIERRVKTIADPRKGLQQLRCAFSVYAQIERLSPLPWRYREVGEKLESFRTQLQRYNGLLDWQMAKVKNWSAVAQRNWGIPNTVSEIDFPANDEALRRYKARQPSFDFGG